MGFMYDVSFPFLKSHKADVKKKPFVISSKIDSRRGYGSSVADEKEIHMNMYVF